MVQECVVSSHTFNHQKTHHHDSPFKHLSRHAANKTKVFIHLEKPRKKDMLLKAKSYGGTMGWWFSESPLFSHAPYIKPNSY